MKKVMTIVLAAAFALSATVVIAKSVKCVVDAVEGDKITMTCKKADKLEVGDKVKVKKAKKKALEGC